MFAASRLTSVAVGHCSEHSFHAYIACLSWPEVEAVFLSVKQCLGVS